MILDVAIAVLAGYILGSVPFGLIVGKLLGGIDVREYGSGNIGFSNVLRNVGALGGAITLICDLAKGALPVILADALVGNNTSEIGAITFDAEGAQVAAAIAAVVGHNWSIFLRFQGGKGVATSLGAILAMSPLVGLGCLLIGIAIMVKFRYVSVGSMIGGSSSVLILAPLVATDNQPVEYLIYGAMAAVLIVLRHQENIRNLRMGTEQKIGQKGVIKR